MEFALKLFCFENIYEEMSYRWSHSAFQLEISWAYIAPTNNCGNFCVLG